MLDGHSAFSSEMNKEINYDDHRNKKKIQNKIHILGKNDFVLFDPLPISGVLEPMD